MEKKQAMTPEESYADYVWREANEEKEVKCNHHGVDSGGTDYYGTSNPPQEWDWNYSYCPKCGEKL